MDYNIFDLGFSKQLLKTSYLTPLIQNDMEVSSYLKSDFFNATNPTNISSGNTVGNLIVTDGYLKSSNYLAGVSGWQLTPTSADLNISLSVDEIHIPDEVTANSFHTDTDGNSWWGAVALVDGNAKILNTGAATFTNVTISGGSNVKFISDTLDTESKEILKDFIFSPDDYAGAFKSGDIVWDADTGEVVSGSGIVWHAGGIVGAKDGDATFSIDAITGNATFAGTLSAAGGSLGEISTGLITLDSTGYIRGGATGYMTGTGFFMGYDTDAYKMHLGNPSGNNMRWTGTELIVNDSTLNFESVFGDGSDGNVTISADTSLTTDMYYNNLTINSGKTLTCNGYRIFVKGTLTNNGTIKADGNDGKNASYSSPGSGGRATNTGSILGGAAGGTGGSGYTGAANGVKGDNGTSIAKGIGVNGVAGGVGGSRPGNYNGGAGGNAGAITGTIYNKVKNFTSAYSLFDIFPGSVVLPFYSSAGSGGGGSSGVDTSISSRPGGGGGGGGGICWVSAKKIVNESTGIISSKGGKGGDGADGHSGRLSCGGGAGGGGSGGTIIIIYSVLTNSGSISVAGGTGGTGGQGYNTDGSPNNNYSGADGNDGNDGVIIYIKQ